MNFDQSTSVTLSTTEITKMDQQLKQMFPNSVRFIPNEFQCHTTIMLHNDAIQLIRNINRYMHELYMNPWNIHLNVLDIDLFTEKYDTKRWIDFEWDDFIRYSETYIPEYNRDFLKCYAIFIGNSYLFHILRLDNEPLQTLSFACVHSPKENGYECFQWLFYHVMLNNHLDRRYVYHMISQSIHLNKSHIIYCILQNINITKFFSTPTIPLQFFQDMIRLFKNQSYQFFHNAPKTVFSIPNHFNLIPCAIVYIDTIPDLIEFIQYLIQNGHQYNKQQCIDIARIHMNKTQMYSEEYQEELLRQLMEIL
jgi:hypothetical protein